jgi:hypothetical protein
VSATYERDPRTHVARILLPGLRNRPGGGLRAARRLYVPPGHLQRAVAGTEYLQFSPAKEMAEVEQQIMKNVQAMQAG